MSAAVHSSSMFCLLACCNDSAFHSQGMVPMKQHDRMYNRGCSEAMNGSCCCRDSRRSRRRWGLILPCLLRHVFNGAISLRKCDHRLEDGKQMTRSVGLAARLPKVGYSLRGSMCGHGQARPLLRDQSVKTHAVPELLLSLELGRVLLWALRQHIW